jgi:hypothetical protein
MKMNDVARRLCLGGLTLGTVLTTGCASIVSGTNQPISVETRSATGEIVAGANCKLENPKGVWYVTTPGSVTVHRAYDDLSIYCTKTGEQPGIASAKSSTKGMAFGNILFGGIIGAGVDTATGAAYDYPALITVQFGGTTTIAPPAKDKATATPDQKAAMVPGIQTDAARGTTASQ